jgi:hypothetical protein
MAGHDPVSACEPPGLVERELSTLLRRFTTGSYAASEIVYWGSVGLVKASVTERVSAAAEPPRYIRRGRRTAALPDFWRCFEWLLAPRSASM